jgi:hypothetical protein
MLLAVALSLVCHQKACLGGLSPYWSILSGYAAAAGVAVGTSSLITWSTLFHLGVYILLVPSGLGLAISALRSQHRVNCAAGGLSLVVLAAFLFVYFLVPSSEKGIS